MTSKFLALGSVTFGKSTQKPAARGDSPYPVQSIARVRTSPETPRTYVGAAGAESYLAFSSMLVTENNQLQQIGEAYVGKPVH